MLRLFSRASETKGQGGWGSLKRKAIAKEGTREGGKSAEGALARASDDQGGGIGGPRGL